MAIIMLCYARSGGTLLNKCLGSLSDTIILSEVNPVGSGSGKNKESLNSVYEQAKYWYNIELKNHDFKNAIIELDEYCNSHNLNLIIRDWSFINFTPRKENNYNPKNDFLILEELQELQPKIFAFIRDSIDVWISRGMIKCDAFYNRYSKYIERLFEHDIPIFKYEEFTKEPKKEFKKLCDFLNIEYEDIFDEFYKFSKLHGDVQLGSLSRGGGESKIIPLKRKAIPFNKISEINNCKKMIEINAKLDYPTQYEDNINIIKKLKKTVFYIFNKIYKRLNRLSKLNKIIKFYF